MDDSAGSLAGRSRGRCWSTAESAAGAARRRARGEQNNRRECVSWRSSRDTARSRITGPGPGRARPALIGGPRRSACEKKKKNRRASAATAAWRSGCAAGGRFFLAVACAGGRVKWVRVPVLALGAPDLAGPGVGSSLLRRGARCCAGHLENAWQALNPPALVPSLSPQHHIANLHNPSSLLHPHPQRLPLPAPHARPPSKWPTK